MSFVIRKLEDGETLGKRLKAMRAGSGLTLSEMSAKTKVRKHHLAAFEADAFDKLPAPMYARQYLKSYVRALGGDPDYFLRRFDEERGTCDYLEGSRLPVERPRGSLFFVSSRFLSASVFALAMLAVVGYLGLEVRAVTAPPELTITDPADGFSTDSAIVNVHGHTHPEARVYVNGVTVLTDAQGDFSTEVQLERGLNLLEIQGTKRYSRTKTVYRRIVLTENKQTAAR